MGVTVQVLTTELGRQISWLAPEVGQTLTHTLCIDWGLLHWYRWR